MGVLDTFMCSCTMWGVVWLWVLASVPLQHSSQCHKLSHVPWSSPAFWYCAVIENEVRINRGQEASVQPSSSFHSEPITGHLSATHAIFPHTVTASHMGYKQILSIQPSISSQYAEFLCLGCKRRFDADTIFFPPVNLNEVVIMQNWSGTLPDFPQSHWAGTCPSSRRPLCEVCCSNVPSAATKTDKNTLVSAPARK